MQCERRALVFEQQTFVRAGEFGEQLAKRFQRGRSRRVQVQRSERVASLAAVLSGDGHPQARKQAIHVGDGCAR